MEKKSATKRGLEEVADPEKAIAKKIKLFSAHDFRKELKGGNVIKCLKNFINLVQNDENVITEYLEAGGSVEEILFLLDPSAKSDLSSAITVFKALHLIILSVKDDESKHYNATEDGIKHVLSSFLPTVEGMLNINSYKHRKTILKLLASIVTLFPKYGKDVLNLVPTVPLVMSKFLTPSPGHDSIRKWFILFILSFVVGGDLDLIRSIMNIKDLLGTIINDLKYDNAFTVNVFLTVLKEKILENLKIAKTLKLKVFNTKVIVALFELYNWKGPRNINITATMKKKGITERDVSSEDKELVTESVHNFLLVLCTSTKFGVAFTDRSLGSSGEAKNNLLFTVVQSLSEPWENNKIVDVIIGMVVCCPDLLKLILPKLEPSLRPRESTKWYTLLQFVEKLLESVRPKNVLSKAEQLSNPDIFRFAKDFCVPPVLIRQLSSGVHNPSFLVRYYSMRIIIRMWKNTEEFVMAFPRNHKLKKNLFSSFTKSLLEDEEVLTIWQNVCESFTPQSFYGVEKQECLNVLVDYLEVTSKCLEESLGSPSRIASDMLMSLDSCQNSLSKEEYINIQSRVLHLITSVDPMSITPDNNLFGSALNLLFMNKGKSAVESLAKLALSTGVFENNQSEIDVWLACYYSSFLECQDVLPEFFVDCIRRLYLKEINFEHIYISVSSKKETILTELMEVEPSDLIEKKWTSSLDASPTPMLIQSLELLKTSSSSETKTNKVIVRYVSHVAFRLFHYYNNSRTLLKLCEAYKNQFTGSVLDYMKSCFQPDFRMEKTSFLSDAEKELISWISNDCEDVNLEDIMRVEDASYLKLNLIQKFIISCLIHRVSNNCLDDISVLKFLKYFEYLIQLGSSANSSFIGGSSDILSYDIRNVTAFRKQCLRSIFSVPLLERFDVNEEKNKTVVNFTKLMGAIIAKTSEDDLKSLPELKPWRKKFLETIRNSSSVELKISDDVRSFLDCFHYSPSEIMDIINEYSNITDMTTFALDGRVTIQTMILTKFIKLHCDHLELNSGAIKLLNNIMKFLISEKINDLKIIDECFVYLIKMRPKSLLLIDNGLLDDLMKRSGFGSDFVSLGKLLMSDPAKAKHFLQFSKDNFKELKNKRIIVSLVSALIQKGDQFTELLRHENRYCYWKEGEVLKKINSDFACLMKMIYKKYKKHVFLDDSKMDFIQKNSDFFSLLLRRFIGKNKILDWRSNISEGLFRPELIHQAILKHHKEESLLESYVEGLLIILGAGLKDVENGKCEESVWFKNAGYIQDLIDVKGTNDWKNIRDSSSWKDYVRISLKNCFNFPDCPSFLSTLRNLVKLLYEPGENSPYIIKIFQMMISHSQFLNVILQKSRLKDELVKFYYSLIGRNSDVLSEKHIPVLLSSYNASLSESDVTLLKILKYYESSGMSMREYEPLVWGEPAINHYSVRTNVGVSLWRRISMLNLLEFIDPKRLEISLSHFPIERSPKVQVTSFDDKVYDPMFLLSVFSAMLSPGEVTYCLPFVQRGCYAYTLCSLSSMSREIRMIGALILSRFHTHLELVQTMKMKSVWLHFNNCLRFGIEDLSKKPLPSVFTLFLARMSMELSGEPTEMYMSLKNFLLAKPIFTFNCIPEFLPLFHSSDVHYQKQCTWILEVLRDGTKKNADLELLFETMGVKMILSHFKSQFCNRTTKHLILEVLSSIMKTGKSKLLISEYGLMTWLNTICMDCDQKLVIPFVELISSVITRCRVSFIKKSKRKLILLCHTQILNILMKILPNLSDSRLLETFHLYLSLVLDCLLIQLKHKSRNWCKLNLKRLNDLSAAVVKVSGDERILKKYERSQFYVGDFDSVNKVENLYRKVTIVWQILADSEEESPDK